MTYGQRRRNAAVCLICATIVVLIDLLFYLKFYHAMRDNGLNFLEAFKGSKTYFVAFFFTTLVWLILSIMTIVKLGRLNRAYGTNALRVLADLFIICQYICFAGIIVFLFI